MRVAAVFDPTLTTEGTFPTLLPNGVGKMLVVNDSNVNFYLIWGSNQSYVPAGAQRLYCISVGNQPISWRQDSALGGPKPQVSQVIVETYQPNEDIVETYPSHMVRTTNVGNSIPVSTSANATVNVGNSTGTPIVTGQPTGDAGNATLITNDGHATFGDATNHGGLTVYGSSSLDNGNILSDGSGNLTTLGNIYPKDTHVGGKLYGAAGTLTIGDKISADAGAITSDGAGNLSATQVSASNGVNFATGRIKELATGTVTTAGSAIINHGLSGVPACVLVTPDTAGSTATFSASNYTTTQFTLLNGSGVSQTFRWFAFR